MEPSAPGHGEAAHLRSIRTLTRAVCLGRPIDELLGLALDTLVASTPASRAAVLLHDRDGTLRFRAWRGLDASLRRELDGVAPWTSRDVEPDPIVIPDVRRDPRCAPFLAALVSRGVGGLTFVPLHCGRLLGGFVLLHDEGREVSEAALLLAGVVADQVAVALSNDVLAARLRANVAQLDAILRHVGEGITVQDRNGRMLYVNDAAVHLLRAESREDLLDAPIPEALANVRLLDAAGRPMPLDQLPTLAAFRTGRPVSAIVRYAYLDGDEPRWAAVTASTVPDEAGAPSLAVSVFRDITDLRLAQQRLEANERRLRDALDAAREAEQRKDEFLAVLGHELRNPLAPIVTALQVMEMRRVGGDRERALIARHVDHMRRLVDDLLDVSRITSGKLELQRRRVELAEVVAQAIELVSPLLEQRSHGLAIDVPISGMPIVGDPTRLAQVVANLLSNAARYTDPGGHIVVLATQDGDSVLLRVRDDGIGISADVMSDLFELFVQGARSVEQSRGGLGLGLTIVRQLVELHGGEVSVRSDGPGEGSEFVVRLPLARDDAQESRASGEVPHEPPPDRLRILVVDDNVDAARTLADALALLGHLATTAEDGPSALRQARLTTFDVAVLDIGLPIMDGYELARRLRRAHADLRLVAVTGYGQPHDRQRSLDAGFARHLVKPVDLDELLAAIVG